MGPRWDRIGRVSVVALVLWLPLVRFVIGIHYRDRVLDVAEDDDDGVTVDDDEVLAVHGQRDAVIGGVMGSWPC